MAHLYSASETEVLTQGGSAFYSTTPSGAFDSGYARAPIRLDANSATTWDSAAFAQQTTYWHHMTAYVSGSGTGTALTLYNNSGTAVFRLQSTAGGTMQVQYWNGSAWTQIGSNWSYSASTKYTLDLKVICGGSGSMEFYVDNTLVTSGSASMSSVTDIAKFRLGNYAATNQQTYYSEVFSRTTATVGCRLESEPPTSAGTDTDGTGAYTDIDEYDRNDGDSKVLPSSGNKASFKSAARTQGGIGTALAVTVTARASTDSGQSIKFYLLISGTRYYSGSIALTASLLPYQYTWETNPATSSPWVLADAQSANLEWGYEVV